MSVCSLATVTREGNSRGRQALYVLIQTRRQTDRLLQSQSAWMTSLKIRLPSGAEFVHNRIRHNSEEDALVEKDNVKTSGRDYLARYIQRDLSEIPSTHPKESWRYYSQGSVLKSKYHTSSNTTTDCEEDKSWATNGSNGKETQRTLSAHVFSRFNKKLDIYMSVHRNMHARIWFRILINK